MAVRHDELERIRGAATPLLNSPRDYDALLDAIGERRIVLLGEATHGTHEFYQQRAEITKRLIVEKGFRAVAAEADWPDAQRVNRFVQSRGIDRDAMEALADFRRFPAWMWRNAEVLDFVGWLRDHNERTYVREQAGFYGMDLYSLHSSIAAVLDYLRNIDPAAAERARQRYSCFEHFGEDPQAYGYAAAAGLDGCEDEVTEQLVELRRRAAEYARRDGRVAEDEFFSAEQNARLAANAEAYYRMMYRGRASSWNLRDQHMTDTLEALDAHLSRGGEPARIVVWAHNSHLGDARATEMGNQGEHNVGQLVRESWGQAGFLVGFTTFSGTVTASTDWDGEAERKQVRPAIPDSVEDLFHNVGIPDFLLIPSTDVEVARVLSQPRLERAIGVIYRPETERWSHYFHSVLSRQFNAVIHFDHTRAVEPLERGSLWLPDEAPQTFPSTY